ncbi:MAG: hypothetical protein HC778_01925 [Chamaesiphon sp. CSU_1_12]|nr:hypothetical protein [Chamaesiphon sp. CSU_1_12]
MGGGGFGIAYRAFDRKRDRLVVIKTLNQRQQNQADFTKQQEKTKALTRWRMVQQSEVLSFC